jgi:hypothetical protein
MQRRGSGGRPARGGLFFAQFLGGRCNAQGEKGSAPEGYPTLSSHTTRYHPATYGCAEEENFQC